MVNGYDMVYKWFDHLKQQGYGTIAYVIKMNFLNGGIKTPTPACCFY